MNYPAASCGVSENLYDNSSDFVTPECFYRGSSSGLDSRLKHAGMTDLGLLIYLTQQAAGNEPVEIQHAAFPRNALNGLNDLNFEP